MLRFWSKRAPRIVAEVKARVAVAMVAEETVEAVAMGQAAQVEDRMAARVVGAREVEVMGSV